MMLAPTSATVHKSNLDAELEVLTLALARTLARTLILSHAPAWAYTLAPAHTLARDVVSFYSPLYSSRNPRPNPRPNPGPPSNPNQVQAARRPRAPTRRAPTRKR